MTGLAAGETDMVIDHAGTSVADLARAQQFYADVFGFVIVEDSFALPQHDLRGLVLCSIPNSARSWRPSRRTTDLSGTRSFVGGTVWNIEGPVR